MNKSLSGDPVPLPCRWLYILFSFFCVVVVPWLQMSRPVSTFTWSLTAGPELCRAKPDQGPAYQWDAARSRLGFENSEDAIL